MTSSCGSLHVRLRCAADVSEKNTNQPCCKMLLTFKTYPRLSLVEKHHRSVTPAKLQEKRRTTQKCFLANHHLGYTSGDRVFDVLTSLSDLQTRTRRKDGAENFGGFVYVLDRFPQRDFVLWVFMCPINFSLFFWVSFPAATPRATTPHRSLFRLPRRGLPRPYIYMQSS